MKTASQRFIQKALAVANVNMDAFDISMYSGLALQVNCPAGATGGVKLQWSNDGVNWIDVASGSTALAASTGVGVVVAGVYGTLARISINVTAGAGNYDLILTAKER